MASLQDQFLFFPTGIGQKANDSLANIFDTTGHEDYESCPQDETTAFEKEYVLKNEEEQECKEHKEGMEQEEQMEETQFMDGKTFTNENSLLLHFHNH